MSKIPKRLRIWFIIHFVVDILFAIPLFFAPVWFLQLFGFTTVEPVMARLVAAALFGIGGASYFCSKDGEGAYKVMLNLKILWSLTAILGLLYSLEQGAPRSVWIIIAIFALFLGIWTYYKKKI